MVEGSGAVKIGNESILEPLPHQVIKARDDLTKVLSVKHGDKPSVYEHIVKVIDRICASCPDRAIERFEEISYLIKNEGEIDLDEFVRCSVDKQYSQYNKSIAEGTSEGLAKLGEMFAGKAADAGGEGEGEAAGPVLGLVQDLPSLNRHVFNQAGFELGEYGSIVLQKSLQKLSKDTDSRSLRLFGKIAGTVKDYYVVEAFEPKTLPEDTRPEGGEARGSGVNEYSYYVANGAQGPWTLLPDLEP